MLCGFQWYKNITQWDERVPLAECLLWLGAKDTLCTKIDRGKKDAYAFIGTPGHLSLKKSAMKEIGAGILTFYWSKMKLPMVLCILMLLNSSFKSIIMHFCLVTWYDRVLTHLFSKPLLIMYKKSIVSRVLGRGKMKLIKLQCLKVGARRPHWGRSYVSK